MAYDNGCGELAMKALTVNDVLDMPEMRQSGPRLVAGATGVDRRVRWVHTTELADIAPLLRGGDLLLSTGIALPETPEGLRTFATSLELCDAAGLIIELGRRWPESLPAALVDACDELGLPLIALAREVRFATVAQAVGERIVDHQLAELREAERVHETFTELSAAEAGPQEILEATQRLAGVAVVLESEHHHVLDYRSGPDDISAFLADWTPRSRWVRLDGRTTWDENNGWLVTRLGKRSRGWGRLIVQAPTRPTARLVALAERAAAALAMHRLHDRHRASLIRRTHHELLLRLLADPTDPDVQRRCDLTGFPTRHRRFVGITMQPEVRVAEPKVPREALVDAIIAATDQIVHELDVPALMSDFDRDVRMLLSLPTTANVDRVVDQVAGRLKRRYAVLIGAGRTARSIVEADRTLREAQHVVHSVRERGSGRTVHRLVDVHLRGLLALLGDDERVQLFVERELRVLKAHDARRGTDLLGALRALVRHPASKSEAAASLHISRPVFYDRIAKIEALLGVDLQDPDIRVSLHVALVADEVIPPPCQGATSPVALNGP